MIYVFRHVPHEGLGTLAELFERAGEPYQYLDLYREVPERFPYESAKALVVMGGPMNVYENDLYPFLDFEDDAIRGALERELPVLGICLGSQLLARALGARVRRNPVKEIGWYELRPSPEGAEDALFRHLAPRECVFQWHGDTFDLPLGAVHLASSELCFNQAFRYGERSYGLQFHLEVGEEMIREWLAEPGNDAELLALGGSIDPAAMLAETPRHARRQRQLAEAVFGEWLDLL